MFPNNFKRSAVHEYRYIIPQYDNINMTFILFKFIPRPTRREDLPRLCSISAICSSDSATTMIRRRRIWGAWCTRRLHWFHSQSNSGFWRRLPTRLLNSFGEITFPCLYTPAQLDSLDFTLLDLDSQCNRRIQASQHLDVWCVYTWLGSEILTIPRQSCSTFPGFYRDG